MLDAAFLSSDLFLLTLTVGLYCLGALIYRRARLPLLHPVLLTFIAVIVFLRCAGIGYERYRDATASPSSRLFCRFDGWVKYCLSSQRRQVSSPPQQQPVSSA